MSLATPARLIARQRRCTLSLPRRALLISARAQQHSKGESKGEGEAKNLQATPPSGQQGAVARRGGDYPLPSLGRMNQASLPLYLGWP